MTPTRPLPWAPDEPSVASAQPPALELPIDLEAIRATVHRAQATTTVLPQYQDLVELEQLLRGHLNLLLPAAQAHTDRLNRGTARWHQRQTTIDRALRTLDEGLGDGLMSAAVHVWDLGRHCAFLLNWHENKGR